MSRPHLVLFRDEFTPTATFGVLSLVERVLTKTRLRRLTETVERERDHNRASTADRPGACIPAGTYTLRRVFSETFGVDVFEVTGVPGRLLIRIHWANWSRLLRGCIAPGLTRAVVDDQNPETTDDSGVTSSRKAFALVMAELEGHDEATLTIIDAIPEL